MDDIEFKTCVVCITEKRIEDFYNKYRECKQCNIKRVLNRYYNNKDGILQKRWDKYARFKDLDLRLKAVEEKFSIKDSENNWCFFCERNLSKRITPQTKTDVYHIDNILTCKITALKTTEVIVVILKNWINLH